MTCQSPDPTRLCYQLCVTVVCDVCVQRNADQHWWEVTVDLPADMFRADFVFFDKRSQQYDNNTSK